MLVVEIGQTLAILPKNYITKVSGSSLFLLRFNIKSVGLLMFEVSYLLLITSVKVLHSKMPPTSCWCPKRSIKHYIMLPLIMIATQLFVRDKNDQASEAKLFYTEPTTGPLCHKCAPTPTCLQTESLTGAVYGSLALMQFYFSVRDQHYDFFN